MYNLGEHFKNKDVERLKANPDTVCCGNKYRITILSERLLRLEYNEGGTFHNLETVNVKNRLFPMPEFSKKEDERTLVIETKYFTLHYFKNSMFSNRTLYADIGGEKAKWFFGNKEVRNLGGTSISLDKQDVKPNFAKGLFSMDGYATIDDTKSMCFDENGNYVQNNFEKNYYDIYLFIYGKDFGLCLMDYFTLTGMPPLIPRYALGNWWSREYNYNSISIEELMDKFTRHNIPFSVLLLDNGWSKVDSNVPEMKNSFTFNDELYPNYTDFLNKMHEKGLKVGVKVNPQYGFSSVERYYEEAKKYLPVGENGKLEFNPYDMKSIDVFLKIFVHPLKNSGVDIIWNDYYEQDINKMYLMNYYMHKDTLKDNKRDIILMRNGIYSSHLHNVLYSGRNLISWNALKILPFFNITNANLGISFWSHDVAGSISGIEDSDFYLRSIQFGVFSSILRFSTEKGEYFKREPWKWDVVTESIASDYLRFRHKLIPYLYSEAYNYHKFGKLIIQPFYYYNLLFYDDENYVNQYYFGSAFMISPIIKPMDDVINRTIQKFYMPNGVWYDFKNGKRFLGNHKYIAFYSISDYPIFVKRGSIIPLAGGDSYMDYHNPKTLEVHVFPGESNTYHLYEDDGETMEYENGRYCITEFDYNYRKSNYTLIIRPLEGNLDILPGIRNYDIVFRNTKKSENVYVHENDTLKEDIVCENTDTDFIIHIKDINPRNQLIINCYGEDIEIDSVKLIKDDIDSILFDLKINTILKDDIARIVFDDNLSLGKKRIEIRKLKKKGLDSRSIKIFLRLLEYMSMEE